MTTTTYATINQNGKDAIRAFIEQNQKGFNDLSEKEKSSSLAAWYEEAESNAPYGEYDTTIEIRGFDSNFKRPITFDLDKSYFDFQEIAD